MRQRFIYTYNPSLAYYLQDQHNIKFNCSGLNTKTKNRFWQFDNNEQTEKMVEQYYSKRSIKNEDNDNQELIKQVRSFLNEIKQQQEETQ